MKRFMDRQREMQTLEREYQREEAAFVVIYGRRRVGKTTLITEFCKGKDFLYFLATEEGEQANLSLFKSEVAELTQNKLLAQVGVDRWETIFDVIADYCDSKEERIVIVIDEFQYLGKANPAFPSILMNIWDRKLKEKNLMLIVCGSLIRMMTSQVLNYDSLVYGRRTAQIRLGQIPFQYYGEFYPENTMEQNIEKYAITGGVPKYINMISSHTDIYGAIKDTILNQDSFLYAEPEFLLRGEVNEIGSYFSILKVIAAGNHKLGKIATMLNLSQASITQYLKILMELDIIEREVPITEENPEKSKKGLYHIKDNYLRFWFRFVYPYKGMLETGMDDYVLDKIKANFIDNHVAFVYEEICREKLRNMRDLPITFNRIGRWWGEGDLEIDLVAYDSFGSDIFFGECKYSVNAKDVSVLYRLKEKANRVSWKKNEGRKEYYVIFSRSGFTKELISVAEECGNVLLFDGEFHREV